MNLFDLAVQFLDYGRTTLNYSVYTLKGYRSDLLAFVRWLALEGVTEPAQITKSHIQRYDVMHGQQGKRPRTRRRKIAAIRAFTSWLIHEAQAIERDPAAKIKLPAEDEADRTAPTDAEKMALFEGAGRMATEYESALATMMLAGMFYAGLRPMEVIALDLEDIDADNRNLVVRCGKGGKRREIPINDTLASHIAAWLVVRRPDPHGTRLLVSPLHRAVTYYLLRTMMVRVKVAGGLRHAAKLTAHCLRHWFASKLRTNKVDLEIVMKLLGHSHLNTTQHYLHQLGDGRRDAVQGLNGGPDAHPRRVLSIEDKPSLRAVGGGKDTQRNRDAGPRRSIRLRSA